MLKDTDRYKKESDAHITNEYKRKRKSKHSYKDIMVFVSVFVIGLLIILGFAKILSPNVDVEIADNEEYSELEDEEPAGSIDERLKKLQMDDETGKSDEMFSPELDEKVVLPTQKKKTTGEMESELQHAKQLAEKASEKTDETKKEDKPAAVQTPPVQSSSTTYRVVVGQYATDKQAEVAKSILQDAGLGLSPIVKNIGGSYTLQVGVFSAKDKAQNLSNSLLKSNFPARIVE